MPTDPEPGRRWQHRRLPASDGFEGNIIVDTTSASFNIYQTFSSQTGTRIFAWNQFSLSFGGWALSLRHGDLEQKSLGPGGQGSFHCSVSGHCGLGGVSNAKCRAPVQSAAAHPGRRADGEDVEAWKRGSVEAWERGALKR